MSLDAWDRPDVELSVSGSSVISEVTTELRRQLFDAFTASPDHDLGLTSVESISLTVPKELDQNAVASLYLYRVAIDEHLRNQRPLPDRTDKDLLRRPPTPLRLHYLFTPVSEKEDVNQILVGRLLQHFHDFPTFTTLSNVPIGDSDGGAPPALRVVPETLTLEQLSQLWTAFSASLRAAAPFRVETVAIDSAQPPRRAPRTNQLVAAVGQAGGPA
jgi:hypothetical protein